MWEKAQDGVGQSSASFSQDGLRMAPNDTALARAAHSDAADIVLRRNSDRLHARRSPTDRSLPVPLARNTLVLRRSPHRAPHSPGQQSSSRAAVLICVCGARARAKKGLVAVLTPSPTPAQAAAQGDKAKGQSNGNPKSRGKKQKIALDPEREAADAEDDALIEAPTRLFRCSVRHTQSSLTRAYYPIGRDPRESAGGRACAKRVGGGRLLRQNRRGRLC